MKRYELVDGSSAKFWQFEVRGSELVVEFGRLGTRGQSQTKAFGSPAEAAAAAAKLVKEKTGKGYHAVEGGGAEAEAPTQAASALPDGLTEADLAKVVQVTNMASAKKNQPESPLRRFSVRDFSSNRSWDLEVEGGRLSVRASAPGAPGETEQLDCASEDEALELAAARISEALGADVQALEDGLEIYQNEFGDELIEVGSKGNKVMLRTSDVRGRHFDPRETRWARFESPRVAKASVAKLQQFVNQAIDEARTPELPALAELLAPPAQVPECPCSECARLLQEGARPPSMSSSSVELSFTEHATPVIVAGKQLAVGVATDVLRELCERVDAFAKKEGLKVALVAQSPPTWPPEGILGRALVIGQVIAVGNHHDLTEMSVVGLRKGLEAAKKLPWKKLMPLLEDDRLQSPEGLEWECLAEPDDEVKLRVFATGVMASGMVGFGVPRPDRDADGQEDGEEDESEGELEEVWGQDMDQKRLRRLVYGQYAGVCDFHDNDGPGIVDASSRAHDERTAALGALGKKARYYLVGRYD